MHLGMPEYHKLFLGHSDLDLWPSFQELLCPEHIWCRNTKFGVVIPLGMMEWCIPFLVTLTLTLTSGLISRFLVLYYSYLSSNVSYARPIPLGAFVTCLWHFLFIFHLKTLEKRFANLIFVLLLWRQKAWRIHRFWKHLFQSKDLCHLNFTKLLSLLCMLLLMRSIFVMA